MANYFKPANVLLPKIENMTAWSVVACDQFTSEPEYWEKAREIVSDNPSTLNMILPEAELTYKDPEVESEKIYSAMSKYISDGLFTEHKDSYIIVNRTLADGNIRRGIVGMFDMEAYDWSQGTATPIRATEHTVEDRLPPRIAIRKNAVIELPHIMVFIDDPDFEVMNAAKKGEKLYDFELMLGGGHIEGWKAQNNRDIDKALMSLADADILTEKYGNALNPIIYAMGDGNHSFAAAKKYWESVKSGLSEEEKANHPARFALAELVNIHDDAIVFEPIHKVVFNTDNSCFIDAAKEYFADYSGTGREVKLVAGDYIESIFIDKLTIGQLIGKFEDFCVEYTAKYGGYIDYIHGDEECLSMGSRDGCAGVLLPKMEKSELFDSVMKSGPFPKKSFSIGHGPDKRYYLECRKIK